MVRHWGVRLIYHATKIAKRSHAKRAVADFDMDSTFKEKWLDDTLRRSLEKYHKKFRSAKTLDAKILSEYEALISGILHKMI